MRFGESALHNINVMAHSPARGPLYPPDRDILHKNIWVVSSCKVYLESESALSVIYVYVYYSSIMAVMRVMQVMCVMAVM